MKHAIVALSMVLCIGCEQDVVPPPPDDPDLITGRNADSLRIEFTDFDRVRITHQSGSHLKSREFMSVGLGISDSTGYRELFTSGSTYDPANDVYFFDLDFSMALDSTKVSTSIVVRYYYPALGFLDIDTTILQYKYPYATAEIFLTNSIMVGGGHFQDIDRIGNKFYFHPTGSRGLYEYDLTTQTTRTLFFYGSGDHIAADSIFVFCDIGHRSIRRYNTLDDSIDLVIASYPPTANILGLEAYGGFLYSVINDGYLRKHKYDGVLVDSIVYPIAGFHLTIGDGIIYSTDYGATLYRVDMTNMTQLSSVRGPARNLEGIRVIDGVLHFCDFYKNIVGVVPVGDLN